MFTNYDNAFDAFNNRIEKMGLLERIQPKVPNPLRTAYNGMAGNYGLLPEEAGSG